MKKDEFFKFAEKISRKIEKTLMDKGEAYSGDYDRFANFKLMSAITGDRPVVMSPLLSCLIRQLDKIQRAVNLLISGYTIQAKESMDDTLLDNIGYGYMAAGIWKEMKEKKKFGGLKI